MNEKDRIKIKEIYSGISIIYKRVARILKELSEYNYEAKKRLEELSGLKAEIDDLIAELQKFEGVGTDEKVYDTLTFAKLTKEKVEAVTERLKKVEEATAEIEIEEVEEAKNEVREARVHEAYGYEAHDHGIEKLRRLRQTTWVCLQCGYATSALEKAAERICPKCGGEFIKVGGRNAGEGEGAGELEME